MRKLHVLAAAAAMTASSLFADVQIGKGLSVGGYLDLVYERVSNDNPANTDTAGFNVATAEIDFMMDFGSGLTAQVDLEGNVSSDGMSAAGPDGVIGTADDVTNVEIEQARIDYSMGEGTLTLGKFDTFIGLEALEGPDLYQYSVSLTTDLQPTQHEGIAYSYDNGSFNAAAAIVNSIGSDNGNVNGDSEELSYAAKVGFTPSEALSFNLSYATEENTVGGTAAGFDHISFDVSYSNHGWTVGAEYVTQEQDNNGGETDAFMVMANYMFNEQVGVTVRYSAEETDDLVAGVTAGDSENSEMTFCVSYAVTPNWSALVEYRTEEDDLVANSGMDTIAVETILTF